MADRERLEELTDRWRRRHDARRPNVAARPVADRRRQAMAARSFPFRTMTPEAYVAAHGADMGGFTYDDERYDDADLDAWIVEAGGLLREARNG